MGTGTGKKKFIILKERFIILFPAGKRRIELSSVPTRDFFATD